jgi:uncharacterized protein YyaL (SSP411 family)
MADGQTRGAFFTLQHFPAREPVTFAKRGGTQAQTEILTSQSTGAALWSLLYYRRVTGERTSEIEKAIAEAAQWLLESQRPDGGWPYAVDLKGQPVDGASSSGSIWNIWALWRLGQETHRAEYLKAARRGQEWFARTFVEPHYYHGYWEDMGPNTTAVNILPKRNVL